MSANNIKQKALKGSLWSAVDKFAYHGISFIISIFLARLLMPSDYGLIGMISIFISISNSFINSGLGMGLIQKVDRTEVDFSTVFIFNLVVSGLFYIVLFFSAPIIANFYDIPKLVILTRVLSINIIISSFAIVQRTKLTIDIDFETIAKINLLSILISGTISIIFAFKGLGVWSLVLKQILESVISLFMLWIISKWRPSFIFSKESFKSLFGFSSKLLAASLYGTTLVEINNIVIGKVYSSTNLGYYNRAKGFAEMTAGSITSVLSQVTYPILASLQNDREKLVQVFRRLIKMSAFLIFPSITLLSLIVDPFIRYFLTDKWIPAIVLSQWFAFAKLFYPIGVINLNILNAVGRSDLYLKVDLSKLPMVLIALFITIPLGVKAIVIGQVITSFISFFINAYMPGKMFNYGGISQLRDMIPVIISTFIMAVFVYFSMYFIDSLILKMIIGIVTGIIIYWTAVNIFKVEEVKEVHNLLRKHISKKPFSKNIK